MLHAILGHDEVVDARWCHRVATEPCHGAVRAQLLTETFLPDAFLCGYNSYFPAVSLYGGFVSILLVVLLRLQAKLD